MKNTTISQLLIMVLSLVLSLSLLGHGYAQRIVMTDDSYAPPVSTSPVSDVPTSTHTSSTTTTVTTTTLTPVTTNNNLNDVSLTPVTQQVVQTSSSQLPQFTPPTDTGSAAAQLYAPDTNTTAYVVHNSNSEPTTSFGSFAEAATYTTATAPTSVAVQSIESPTDPIATVTTTTLAGDVAALLQQGQTKAREALAIYTQHHIGQPLWQEALQLGLQATRRAPNSFEPVYFVAEVYSLTNYWALAWDSWIHYFALGGAVTPETQRQVANVGIELGYLYYNEGHITAALNLFRQVSELAPNSPNGFIWTARVLHEQGNYTGALQYWQRANVLAPEDEAVQFYLAEAQAQARPVAVAEAPAQVQLASFQASDETSSTFFEQGVASFEQGNYAVAERFFRDALQGDNSNAAAWAYLARAAVAQQNLPLAQQAIGRATFLAADNVDYRNLEVQITNLAGN